VLDVPTSISVRDYRSDDLPRIVEIYKAAFAEPPWNEEWSDEQVVDELEAGLLQSNPIVLVAQNSSNVFGMTWGYDVSPEKFPFLAEMFDGRTSYIAELAVDPQARRRGIGVLLGNRYVETARRRGVFNVVLRTDERNPAAMGLYKGLGFSEIGTRDPKYKNRIYLVKSLREEDGI
jgi:ribosomal-protein-alanine N-acetyltransferase